MSLPLQQGHEMQENEAQPGAAVEGSGSRVLIEGGSMVYSQFAGAAPAFVCKIDETQQGNPEDHFLEDEIRDVRERIDEKPDNAIAETAMGLVAQMEAKIGVRSLLMAAYNIPQAFYSCEGMARIVRGSAPQRLRDLGCIIKYADEHSHTGRKRRPPVDIDALVKKWHVTIVGLAVAHDKDGVDRYEAAVEECLTPILSAPVKQLREFGPKLLESLKADTAVPYLVWRAYEVWIEQMKDAPDEDIKVLKQDLAADIVKMVEEDAKAQLPDAMIRALMWRSPSTLQEVKEVVEEEKKAGRGVRLKGRESCLFLEAGGTVEQPRVCVQV
jgi:hypothetical protein